MVFYYLPTEAEQPKRGRRRTYGKRADFRHWTYETLAAKGFKDEVEIASRIVRSKCCPEKVRLVVRSVLKDFRRRRHPQSPVVPRCA